MSAAMFSHPLTLFLYEITIGATAIAFCPPSSAVRYVALLMITACVLLAIPTCLEKMHRVSYAGLLAGSIIGAWLQYVEKALLSQWCFTSPTAERGSTAPKHNGGDVHGKRLSERGVTTRERLVFGHHAMFSYRNVGAPDEVKNVPPFSTKDLAYEPSRGQFLLKKAVILVVCYATIDLITFCGGRPEENHLQFSADKVPLLRRFGDVSLEELVLRLATTVSLFVVLYCFIQCYTSIVAIVGVATGMDEVKHWRPTFGSLSEAYTIRRFWG